MTGSNDAAHVCPPDHEHGASTRCYLQHGCRDRACRDGQAKRARERRRQLAYGTYTRGRLPVAPVRAHLEYLARYGMGAEVVSTITGIPIATLGGIRWGRRSRKTGEMVPTQTVTRAHSKAILALQPELHLLADGAFVPARGTQRRLQALGALGWTLTALGDRLGLAERRVAAILQERFVTARTARSIVALYDELWATRPTGTTPNQLATIRRATRRAARLGWVPPMAWDDIDTDPTPPVRDDTAAPSDEPDEVAIAAAVDGHRPHLTTAERHAALKVLHARGHWDKTLADLLSVSTRTIERDRGLLGLESNYITQMKDAA